jgi:hypothetical protein
MTATTTWARSTLSTKPITITVNMDIALEGVDAVTMATGVVTACVAPPVDWSTPVDNLTTMELAT